MFYFLNDLTTNSPFRYLIYALDIIIVASFMYVIYLLMRKTKVYSIAIGILLILVFTIASRILNLSTVTWIFDRLFQVGVIAVVVLFQSEIKHGLRVLGSKTSLGRSMSYESSSIQKIVNASYSLSCKGFGALIVLQKTTSLHSYIDDSVVIDANISEELIETIFYKNTPIHDGAVIITQNKIDAVSVYLPLTQTEPKVKNKRLGTRHRAAIGISEHTDAVVIVVSEENQCVSIVHNAELEYNLTKEELKNKIKEYLEIK